MTLGAGLAGISATVLAEEVDPLVLFLFNLATASAVDVVLSLASRVQEGRSE